MSTEPILTMHDLHVSYGRVPAVRDVSIEVHTGDLVTVVGANGAGKTSVLAAVAGLVRAHAGTIRYGGEDITRWPAHRRVAAGLVLVPEGRQILGTLTVAENLRLGGWRVDRQHRVADVTEQVYDLFPVLAQRRSRAAGTLSGGEQQMLAIGRALVAQPRLMLMDEPSMGLAPRMVDEVYRVIDTIRATGVTVVLVEQNARRALGVADTGYVLRTGTIAQSGPAAQLLADPRVVQAYLGGA